MDWTQIIDFLLTLKPWVAQLFMLLGTLTTVMSVVDGLIPDEKDHGFYNLHIRQIPLLGDFLEALRRFSIFQKKP